MAINESWLTKEEGGGAKRSSPSVLPVAKWEGNESVFLWVHWSTESSLLRATRLPDPAPGLPEPSVPHLMEEDEIQVVKASLQDGDQSSVGGVPNRRLFLPSVSFGGDNQRGLVSDVHSPHKGNCGCRRLGSLFLVTQEQWKYRDPIRPPYSMYNVLFSEPQRLPSTWQPCTIT